MSAATVHSPSTTLGKRYKILRELGGGGMKRVYLAEDVRLHRKCALAQMIDSFKTDAQRQAAVSSFEREAELLAKLDNADIPQIYDRFSENKNHYLVMEYVPGRTLEQRLADEGILDETFLINVAHQILDALAYLHGLAPPVIYRDMKPSNVIVRGENGGATIKLVDFGIARHFKSNEKVTTIGTPGYAPPEQYAGKPEPRSDLYAVGATLHHLLTGRDPASGKAWSFPPVLTLRPSCNPVLAKLIDETLVPTVEERLGSAAEFKRRLTGVAAAKSPSVATAETLSNAAPSISNDTTVVLSSSRASTVPDSNRASVRAPVKMANKLANQARLVLQDEGKEAEAIALYTEALSYDSLCLHAWQGRGELYFRIGDYEQAINDLIEAEALDSNANIHPQYHRLRAFAKIRLGRYQEALNEWSVVRPSTPQDYYNRGLAKFRLESYASAIDDFTRGLAEFERCRPSKRDPASQMQIRYMRALAHKRLGSTYYSWGSEYRADYRCLSKKAQAALDHNDEPGPMDAFVIGV